MVAISEPFRPHWEAEDEFRKIDDREAHAEWLRWWFGVMSPTLAEPSSHESVHESTDGTPS